MDFRSPVLPMAASFAWILVILVTPSLVWVFVLPLAANVEWTIVFSVLTLAGSRGWTCAFLEVVCFA